MQTSDREDAMIGEITQHKCRQSSNQMLSVLLQLKAWLFTIQLRQSQAFHFSWILVKQEVTDKSHTQCGWLRERREDGR